MKTPKENVLLGSFFILLAATAYAVMSALVKKAGRLDDAVLVFGRNFFCLLFLLPFLPLSNKHSLATPVFKNHLIRGCAGLLNMYCFFYSLRYILQVDAMLLNNTMPLFVPLVAWIWKGKRVNPWLIPGILLGFLGILLILRPGWGLFQPASLLALASGIFMSVSIAGVRELGKSEPVYRILFYYFFLSTLFSLIPFLFSLKGLTASIWLELMEIGALALVYQWFLVKGYQKARATKISPMIYFAVILSGVFDWVWWGQVPGYSSYVGVVLVVIGAIYCLRLE